MLLEIELPQLAVLLFLFGDAAQFVLLFLGEIMFEKPRQLFGADVAAWPAAEPAAR